MSAGSDDAGKAGFTARVLGVTEAARFSSNGDASVEADPLRQLRARQRSFEDHERPYVCRRDGNGRRGVTMGPQSGSARIRGSCRHARIAKCGSAQSETT